MFKTCNLKIIFLFILITIGFNSILFNEYLMPLHWLLIGGLVLITMFGMVFYLNEKWATISSNVFQKNIFTLSLIINLIALCFNYLICYIHNGTFFEPGAADSVIYHKVGVLLANNYEHGILNFEQYLDVRDYSDYGFFLYLSSVYYIFGPYTIVARLFNVLLFALTVKSVYKTTELIYNTSIAKTAALITAFSPSLLFFIGVHLKETTMIFVLMNAILYSTKILIGQKNSLKNYLVLFLSIILLFFFRTVLGIVFLGSLIVFYLLNMSFKKNISTFLSVFGIFLTLIFIIYYLNEMGIVQNILQTADQSGAQTDAELNDKISKGGGLSVKKVLVIPLLFVSVLMAPFATFVFLDNQVEIAWLYSGNLMKNILVFFALYGIYYSVKHYKKRTFLIVSLLLSYSIILAVSAQSTSSRYQLVSLPLVNILVALGLHKLTSDNKKKYIIYLFFVFFFIVSWNYFKLFIRNLT